MEGCTPNSTLGRKVPGEYRRHGGKLGSGKVVTSERETDGPFVEAKEVVGGSLYLGGQLGGGDWM